MSKPEFTPGWHHTAYCDWAPIRPHPTQPCRGGCGTEVDAADGLCVRCRKGKSKDGKND